VNITDVERIFQRNNWPYDLVNGRIATVADGVPLLIGVEPNGWAVRVMTIVYRPAAADQRAMRTRSRDLDTFLGAVNRAAPEGMFDNDHQREAVFYSISLPLSGTARDDRVLAAALVRAVAAVQLVGPMIEALVRGEITLSQALAITHQAVDEMRRRRGAA
jgi:hypothetical protein